MVKKRTHRLLDLVVGLFACSLISIAFVSCEETCYDGELNNNEESVDCGGPCVPCDTTGGTCFDGVQNQGETGVDCGGPCNDCITDSTILDPNFVCEGNGSSLYLPISVSSYWIYGMPGGQWFQLEVTGTVSQGNGEEYSHMVTTGAFTANDYYRAENGVIYEWNPNLQVEDVFIPANPVAGDNWIISNGDSIVVDAIDASLSSQNGCQYENLLRLTTYSGSGSTTSFYKKGLGMVQLQTISAYLDSAVVY